MQYQDFMNRYGFYRKKLSLIEIIVATVLIISILICFFFEKDEIENETVGIIKIIILIFLWWVPITKPISERFRNIYILPIWIISSISLMFLFEFPTSILPLLVLILTQGCRLIFKKITKIEPIPLLTYWYPIYCRLPRFSTVLNYKLFSFNKASWSQ